MARGYTAASLLAAAIVTVPNFFANKHFVWRVTSRENLRSQVLVFWVAVMLGVSLATLFTYLVENAIADQTMLIRGAAVLIAQLLGLGIVWVGRLLILDRLALQAGGRHALLEVQTGSATQHRRARIYLGWNSP